MFEIELIVNNAPLTCVCPNTIETCFSSNITSVTIVKNLTVLSSTADKINRTSNHFLDRGERQYVVNLRETKRTYNATSITIVKDLTVLSGTTDKINPMSNHFLDRWRHKYIVNLHETQRTSKLNIDSLKIDVNDIVLVIYEKVPSHFWRIVIVTRVLTSRYSEIREATVRITKTNTISNAL